MAKTSNKRRQNAPKKTRQGHGPHSKYGQKGGGLNGSRPSKLYRKRYRGQGKKR